MLFLKETASTLPEGDYKYSLGFTRELAY